MFKSLDRRILKLRALVVWCGQRRSFTGVASCPMLRSPTPGISVFLCSRSGGKHSNSYTLACCVWHFRGTPSHLVQQNTASPVASWVVPVPTIIIEFMGF